MPGAFETRFGNWMEADRDWIRRAERGPGTAGGVNKTRTAYFYNGAFRPYGGSWGAIVGGEGCGAEPVAVVHPAAHARRERRDPVLRGAVAVRVGGGRAAMPAGVPVGLAVRERLADTRRDPTTDAGADADRRAHPRADAGADAAARTDPDPDARAVVGA